MNRSKLRDALLQLVPADGTTIGNARLRQALGEQLGREVSEDDYAKARDALVAEGVLAKGQGRGGSVRRVVAVAETETATDGADDGDAEEWSLEHPEPKARAAKKAATTKPASKPAPSSRKTTDDTQVLSYRHGDRRKNNPEVGMVNADTDPAQPKTRWAYDPHLDPALQFDVGRAEVETIIDDALATGDEKAMRAALEKLRRMAEPYLAWTGKAERTSFEVDTVSLHVHERIDPASILHAVRKRIRGEKPSPKMMQMGLFSAAFENLPLRDAIDFYKHDKGWSNRLIAGGNRATSGAR